MIEINSDMPKNVNILRVAQIGFGPLTECPPVSSALDRSVRETLVEAQTFLFTFLEVVPSLWLSDVTSSNIAFFQAVSVTLQAETPWGLAVKFRRKLEEGGFIFQAPHLLFGKTFLVGMDRNVEICPQTLASVPRAGADFFEALGVGRQEF